MAKRQSRALRGTYSGGLRSVYSSSSNLLSCAVSEPKVAPDVAKMVMLGDAGVGKTSLVLRLCHDTFDDSSTPTLGVAFSTKDVKRDDGSSIRFQVWDTAGQEQYHSLASLYYRSAHAAVVAFDVTSRSSFKSVRTWIHELSQLGPPDVLIIIVATKTDLAERRIVTETEARAYAESRGVMYIETSAKTRSNVSEIFEALSIQLHGRGGLALARSGRRSASACTEESDNDVGQIVLEDVGKTRRRRLPCFAD